MKAQTPAEGVLKSHDWGDSMVYQVHCDCGTAEHKHDLFVEADDMYVTVNVYCEARTDYYSSFWARIKQKVKVTWDIWTKGVVQTSTDLMLTEQAALNYAATLKSAISDVKKFKKVNKGL